MNSQSAFLLLMLFAVLAFSMSSWVAGGARLKTLKDRAAKLLAEDNKVHKDSADLFDAVHARADKKMTAEEKTADDARRARAAEVATEREALDEQIRSEDLLQKREREAAAAAPAFSSDQREGFENDPSGGFKSRREFFTAVSTAYSSGVVTPQLRALSPKLRGLQATAGSDEQTGLNDPYGGFLIPRLVAPGVATTTAPTNPFGRVRNFPMEAPEVFLNARVDKDHTTSVSGGLQWYRRSEAAAATASRMKFEQLHFQASPLLGISYATEEVLQDSMASFVAMLSEGFQDELGNRLAKETKDGVGAGQFTGFMTSIYNASSNASGTFIRIAAESGQGVGTIVAMNILKMLAQAWRPEYWIINQTAIPQLATLFIPLGTGGAILPGALMWSSAPPAYAPGAVGTLMGLPVYVSEYCEAVGTAGDILLVNMSEYWIGTYEPLSSATSIHVRFETHERTFKFWLRNAGLPAWLRPLTPVKGSVLSPWVGLATR